jgi:carbonic anhydrase
MRTDVDSSTTVTCVDPRVFPEKILKLNFGETFVGEAFIFRTIAGHPQPVFENIIGLDRTSHGFEYIILLYHTGPVTTFEGVRTYADNRVSDCGAMYFDEPMIRSGLLETDPSAKSKIDSWDTGKIKTRYVETRRTPIGRMDA